MERGLALVLDAAILSRIQFGFTIGFHILFPTLNIGLGLFLCILEGLWLRTHNLVYLQLCRFWSKIFALTFGMGVVTGIVLSYEIGTNFAKFTEHFGSILGPVLAYEVLTAFFLEAGFLGIMIFGWKRVSARAHYFATAMVALGTIISSVWIMAANSWMQTPSGIAMDHGYPVLQSWIQVIFNPSFVLRFTHMLLSSFATTGFFIVGVSAYFLLRRKTTAFANKSQTIALTALLVVVPLQIIVGDLVGVKMFHYQPIKTAAMEGVWHTQKGAPLYLFAIPDPVHETNHYAIKIPKLASFFNTHDFEGTLPGMTSVAKKDRPPIIPVFFSFRIMVGLGLLMLLLTVWGNGLRWRGRLMDAVGFQRVALYCIPIGFIATEAGWICSEMGRQPWIVYHLMRTVDSISAVSATHVLWTLICFVITYFFVLACYLYFLRKTVRLGPLDETELPLTVSYLSDLGQKR
jgi:cytochrome bd ubiquinol oxidase subunit I